MRPVLSALLAAALSLIPLNGYANHLWRDGKAPRSARRAATLPDFRSMATAAMPAVVSISTVQLAEDKDSDALKDILGNTKEETQKGIGTGFFIHPDGYILTNAHVVENATDIVVSVSEGPRTIEYPARVVGSDAATDVALLKVEGRHKFPILVLGNSDNLQVAEWIMAVGNPFGLSHSVTVGVVSFKGRTDVMPQGRDGFYDYIQTDASINPGNSGGPILNATGNVVAIANAVNASGQGIGFAIPINMAKEVIEPLHEKGEVKRSWIGITVQDLTPEVARVLGLSEAARGVVVSDVVAGSPGEDAGLRIGDVITTFNNSEIDDAHRLRWMAAIAGVGKKIPLNVRRAGHDTKVVVTLAEVPPSEEAENIPQPLEWGLTVRTVDVPTARTEGLAVPFGARVAEVKTGSAAETAGLKSGDVILKVDDFAIRVPKMLHRALSKVANGSEARLVVRREGKTMFVALPRP